MHGGIEWLIDGHGCVPAKLRDRAAVLGLLDRGAVFAELVGARGVTATEHVRAGSRDVRGDRA